MALAVAASRLTSDSHCSSPDKNPSAVTRLQMAIADTECAQALLELAMSIVPHPDMTPRQNETDQLIKTPLSDEYSPQTQLRHEPGKPTESQTVELVKRIKLDHNYYWAGDERKGNEVKLEPGQFRTYCETIKQNGFVPISQDADQEEENAEGAYQRQRQEKHHDKVIVKELWNQPEKKNASSPKSNIPNLSRSYKQRKRAISECHHIDLHQKHRQRSSSESKVGNRYRIKEKQQGKMSTESKKRGYEHVKQDESKALKNEDDDSDNESMMDTDEIIPNFRLAIKGLGANKGEHLYSTESGSSPHRSQSLSSDDTDDGQSPDSSIHGRSGQEYQCQVCQKSFLKKRYLTKHSYRMHPWLVNEEGSPIKMTVEGLTCPHCKVNINPKKDLQRHIANCPKNNKRWKTQNELPKNVDLVNCQFCGVRMRRQLLVRHLAEEHCVDRIGDFTEEGSIDEAGFINEDNYQPYEDTSPAHNLRYMTNCNSPEAAGSPDISWDDVEEFGAIKKESFPANALHKETPTGSKM